MNLETKWLEDFLALAELRNFSRAAEVRNVTQPAFGRRIRSLEKAVGIELIDRGTTPVGLTAGGRLFRTTARNLLRQMDDGLNQLKGYGSGFQPLEFAAAHSLSVTLLPELISSMSVNGAPFHSRVESIDVDLAVEALQEGRSDFLLAFNMEALMQPPFLGLSLGKTNLRPVCAPDDRGKPLFSIDEGIIAPLLKYSSASFMGRQVNSILRRLGKSASFEPVMESSLTSLLQVMALNGSGIAWLPEYSIQKELKNTTLVDVGGLDWWCEIEVVLYRNDIRLHQSAERFWSSLLKRCNQGWSIT
ncbi:LysR substrate-binding domain-containing protein [Endozoicomonas sp. Mp262]|uniref:LysR family transcriptional regulator n=1 Tax=Endozoicomonas sp. Mp262 TaxID=2919499 RepID=UPI0021D8AC2C